MYVVNCRLHRGAQTFTFPIHLSESILPEAVIYGTFVPVVVYFGVKHLLVQPFLKKQKER